MLLNETVQKPVIGDANSATGGYLGAVCKIELFLSLINPRCNKTAQHGHIQRLNHLRLNPP